MAETIVDITKDQMDLNQGGSQWSQLVVFTGAEDATIILLPVAMIGCLGIQLQGSATLEATLYPETLIRAGSAQWIDWDGAAQINLSVTAIRITPTGTAGQLLVACRTFKN